MPHGAVRRALLALAVGGFAIGTGEFVMMGLLPQVAADLSVPIPRAGQLIAAYALGVVVGAPLLTAASVRHRRKTVLVVLMGWFAAGNVLSALAPSFGLVMVARFATGLPHGAFFGAGAVVAGSLVDKSRSNSAMAVMFAGLTVANIIGVPLTTVLGQHAGWRVVYAMVGVIAALAVLAVLVAVPADAAPAEHRASLRGELRAFAKPEVWLVLGVAMLGGGGLFATFSYIAPMMTDIAGYADSSMTWLLVLFGLGMTVGNLAGARLSDRFPARTLDVVAGGRDRRGRGFPGRGPQPVDRGARDLPVPAHRAGRAAHVAGPDHRAGRRRAEPGRRLDPGRVQHRQLDRRLPRRRGHRRGLRLRLAERGGRGAGRAGPRPRGRGRTGRALARPAVPAASDGAGAGGAEDRGP
jgi:predicted MFS family arabinose efflux permease